MQAPRQTGIGPTVLVRHIQVGLLTTYTLSTSTQLPSRQCAPVVVSAWNVESEMVTTSSPSVAALAAIHPLSYRILWDLYWRGIRDDHAQLCHASTTRYPNDRTAE